MRLVRREGKVWTGSSVLVENGIEARFVEVILKRGVRAFWEVR